MVDHIALVFGVVEAEGAAEVLLQVLGGVVVVAGLHVHGESIPEGVTDKHFELSTHVWKEEQQMCVVEACSYL